MNMLQISTETFQDHCWDTAHAVTLCSAGAIRSGPLKAYSQICRRESFQRQKFPGSVISAFSSVIQLNEN